MLQDYVRRLQNVFKRIGLDFGLEDAPLLDYVVRRFTKLNRKNITYSFIIQSIREFFSERSLFSKAASSALRVEEIVLMLRKGRKLRHPFFISIPANPAISGSLLHLLARPAKSSYKVIASPNELTPTRKKQFEEETAGIDISYSPFVKFLSPDTKGRSRARSANGQNYNLLLDSSGGRVYRAEEDKENWNPAFPSGDIRFKEEQLPTKEELRAAYPGLFVEKWSEFSFTVNQRAIEERIKAKRPISQQKVMGGKAEEMFAAMNAEIEDATRGSFYHHAHRQGWALCGEQKETNMDLSTSGSNYSLLFLVELPLQNLLREHIAEEVHVRGTVENHTQLPIPIKITYHLTWGHGRTAEVSIFPLSYFSPTVADYKVSSAMLRVARTPLARVIPFQELHQSPEPAGGDKESVLSAGMTSRRAPAAATVPHESPCKRGGQEPLQRQQQGLFDTENDPPLQNELVCRKRLFN